MKKYFGNLENGLLLNCVFIYRVGYWIGLTRSAGRCDGAVGRGLCSRIQDCFLESNCCRCRSRFRWIDGQPMNFSSGWANAEPDGYSNDTCGWLTPELHMFGDYDCWKTARYICKRPMSESYSHLTYIHSILK